LHQATTVPWVETAAATLVSRRCIRHSGKAGKVNGLSIFQTLYQTYHDQAVAIAAQQSGQFIQGMLATLRIAIQAWVLFLGAAMIMGRVDFGEAMSRLSRALVVVALMQPARYNEWIIQTFTVTLPDIVSTAIAGPNGATSLKGAQGFDGLANSVWNFVAQVKTQAVGIWYIAERAMIVVAGFCAAVMIFLTFVMWLAAMASIAFMAPLGALLAPGLLFRPTAIYFERWIGKLISLSLVATLAMMLAAFVVQADIKFVQGFGHPAAAAAANPNLETNAGALTFTGFDVPGGPPIPMGAAPTGGGSTVNVDMSIAILWNLVLAYALGVMLLGMVGKIAMGIGQSSGWSAGPAINSITTVASKGGQLAAAGISRGARAVR